ncbi:f-box wd-40 repeat-containing protein [Hordeum vulgare]|nr:f-box wd-40 repeat-containing protein [Hordeum vulgare]
MQNQKSLERVVETKFHNMDLKVIELITIVRQLQHEVDSMEIPRSKEEDEHEDDDDDENESPPPTTTRFSIQPWNTSSLCISRRKAIHEDIHQTPYVTNAFGNSFINELQVNGKPSGEPTASQPRFNHWLAPPDNMIKINVDAALLRNRFVGAVAVVCRDCNRLFLGSSMVTLTGIDAPTTLEALAIRESLALADDLYECKIFVASYCKMVIDDIKKKSVAIYGAII